MRTRYALTALSIAAAALLSGCKAETAKSEMSTEAVASPGRVIFEQQCAICHGKTGKGDTMIAASYQHSNLTDSTWGYGGTRADLIRSTIQGLKEISPKLLIAGHCTGFKALTQLALAFPDTFTVSCVGTKVMIGG